MAKRINREGWIEMLAVWLNGAARDTVGHHVLRRIVRQACETAAELYVVQTPEGHDQPDDTGNRTLLARFAAALDEDERRRIQEDKEEGNK